MTDEKYYLAYVLGYDLLHDLIADSDNDECDVSFELCLDLIEEFYRSELYLNAECSVYDSLSNWIYDNIEHIKSLFYFNYYEKK